MLLCDPPYSAWRIGTSTGLMPRREISDCDVQDRDRGKPLVHVCLELPPTDPDLGASLLQAAAADLHRDHGVVMIRTPINLGTSHRSTLDPKQGPGRNARPDPLPGRDSGLHVRRLARDHPPVGPIPPLDGYEPRALLDHGFLFHMMVERM